MLLAAVGCRLDVGNEGGKENKEEKERGVRIYKKEV